MFSEELKKARLSAYLTQKRLSEETSIPLGNIKNWERGNYLPSAKSWSAIYDFFVSRVSTTELKKSYLSEKTKRRKK